MEKRHAPSNSDQISRQRRQQQTKVHSSPTNTYLESSHISLAPWKRVHFKNSYTTNTHPLLPSKALARRHINNAQSTSSIWLTNTRRKPEFESNGSVTNTRNAKRTSHHLHALHQLGVAPDWRLSDHVPPWRLFVLQGVHRIADYIWNDK